MGKAVFLHRADSIYDDAPDVRYEFPKTYLKAVQEAKGDWIVYYEPVKAGPRGYFAVAKVQEVIESPTRNGMYWAVIAPETYLEFDAEVPRLVNGQLIESQLADESGQPKKGGLQQLAVRRLPEKDFAAIVNLGLPEDLERREAQRYGETNREFDQHQAVFERPIVERLVKKPYREVAFRRKVREAYNFRCAVSGLELRNGGGRPEVQAAHIKPVANGGSDSVRNGLALSGTLHWMFDRGLISVDPDNYRILVSHNKVPGEVVSRLLLPNQTLTLPQNRHHWPHPDNLRWHRENRFGQRDYTL